MPDLVLPISRLLLDEQNPRHRPVLSQEQALAEIVRRAPGKLLNLAKDIAARGLSPIDRAIVLKTDDGYVTLEGNRRLAALRLLADPSKCPDPHVRERFVTLAASAKVIPKKMQCFEVSTREEARPWLDRRHGGEMDGAGTVRWSAMQRTRNATNPGHQERSALATLDWLDAKSAAGANRVLADLLDEVAEEKFTTFGRLASDPDFRAYCGFDLKGDLLSTTDNTENVVVRLSMVLEDFRSERSLTVTELKRKPDRERYIDELRTRMAGADERHLDDPDERQSDYQAEGEAHPTSDAAAAQDVVGTPGGGPTEDDEKPDPPPPMKLFVGLSLANCSARLRNILGEVQRIPLRSYPNSAAALIRMVIELTVHEAYDKCGWPQPVTRKNLTLAHFVEGALKQLDPSQKARRYLDLRTQLAQKDSLVNTSTLNAFLHNPHYSPSAPDMRAISDKYSVMLSDLNRRIGEAKEAS